IGPWADRAHLLSAQRADRATGSGRRGRAAWLPQVRSVAGVDESVAALGAEDGRKDVQQKDRADDGKEDQERGHGAETSSTAESMGGRPFHPQPPRNRWPGASRVFVISTRNPGGPVRRPSLDLAADDEGRADRFRPCPARPAVRRAVAAG